jgi:alpha-N-arabinofuranosidase
MVLIKSNYNLQDGIWVALVLQTFQKKADVCPQANHSEMINVFGAIQIDKDGLILTPMYLAFKLFRDHMQNNYIEDIKIDCLAYDSKKYGRIPAKNAVPYIECCANINNVGDRLSIMLINKHINDSMKINIEINGFNPLNKAKLVELCSESPFDYNTIENRHKIQIIEKNFNYSSPKMNMILAPHSITILKLTEP